jgi:hypothetical protein
MTAYLYTTKPTCPTVALFSKAGLPVIEITLDGAKIPADLTTAYFRAGYETQLESHLSVVACELADKIGDDSSRAIRVLNHPRNVMRVYDKCRLYPMIEDRMRMSSPLFVAQATPAEAIALIGTPPLIVRQSDASTGRKMFLCATREELVDTIKWFRDLRIRYMVCEFFDTRVPPGLFHRRRAWFFDGNIQRHNMLVSKDWCIRDRGHKVKSDLPPHVKSLVTNIVRCLHIDSCAFDFIFDILGRVIVFDVNPNYWYVPKDPSNDHIQKHVAWIKSVR